MCKQRNKVALQEPADTTVAAMGLCRAVLRRAANYRAGSLQSRMHEHGHGHGHGHGHACVVAQPAEGWACAAQVLNHRYNIGLA